VSFPALQSAVTWREKARDGVARALVCREPGTAEQDVCPGRKAPKSVCLKLMTNLQNASIKSGCPTRNPKLNAADTSVRTSALERVSGVVREIEARRGHVYALVVQRVTEREALERNGWTPVTD